MNDRPATKVRRPRILLSALLLPMLVPATACSPSGPDSGPLSGVVLWPNGQPVQNALVRVGTNTSLTDASGYYQIPDIPEGEHRFEVERPSGLSARLDVDHSGPEDLTFDGAGRTFDIELRVTGVRPSQYQDRYWSWRWNWLVPSEQNASGYTCGYPFVGALFDLSDVLHTVSPSLAEVRRVYLHWSDESTEDKVRINAVPLSMQGTPVDMSVGFSWFVCSGRGSSPFGEPEDLATAVAFQEWVADFMDQAPEGAQHVPGRWHQSEVNRQGLAASLPMVVVAPWPADPAEWGMFGFNTSRADDWLIELTY